MNPSSQDLRSDDTGGLVVCVYRCRNEIHVARLIDPFARRGWTVALWALDETPHDLRPFTVGQGPGERLPLLQQCINEAGGAAGWLVMADDDIEFVTGDGAAFVALAQRAGFGVTQPAHAAGSVINHQITLAETGSVARRTTFVECGPLVAFSPEWRGQIVPLPTWRGPGWGMELEWSDLQARGCTLGVVDATPIHHLAPVGADYDVSLSQRRVRAELALRGIRRWHELNLTLERWPVGSARPPWLTTRNREKPAAPGSVADPMKLVMTVGRSTDHELLAANVTFHLAAGVDHIVAPDAQDVEALRELIDEGRVTPVPSATRSAASLRERMELAAVQNLDAAWLIHADPEEFWWPRARSLAALLRSVPPAFGIVRGLWRPFVPSIDDGRPFHERMTLRLAQYAALVDPDSEYDPRTRMAHRAHPAGAVGAATALMLDEPFVPVRGWYPIEILHFPWREAGSAGRDTDAPGSSLHRLLTAFELAEGQVQRGVERGVLIEDTRLRDALRLLAAGGSLELAAPEAVDEALYAADVSAAIEADEIRMRRDLDRIALRVAGIEALAGVRSERWVRRIIRRTT